MASNASHSAVCVLIFTHIFSIFPVKLHYLCNFRVLLIAPTVPSTALAYLSRFSFASPLPRNATVNAAGMRFTGTALLGATYNRSYRQDIRLACVSQVLRYWEQSPLLGGVRARPQQSAVAPAAAFASFPAWLRSQPCRTSCSTVFVDALPHRRVARTEALALLKVGSDSTFACWMSHT